MKYVRCGADPEMLFDLAADPDEQRNLAKEPAYADTITAMRDRVAGD